MFSKSIEYGSIVQVMVLFPLVPSLQYEFDGEESDTVQVYVPAFVAVYVPERE